MTRPTMMLLIAMVSMAVALSSMARNDPFLTRGRGGSSTTSLPMVSMEAIPELKAPPVMYAGVATTGGAKASLSPLKTLLLGIISGCHIGFGAFLSLAVGGACPAIATANPGLKQIIAGAFGLPFGLMLTVIGGGELFTGNTAMLTAAVMEKKASLKGLAKNWFFSYVGNFIGSLILAGLAHSSGTLGAGPAAAAAAVMKTSLPFKTAFVRGILCNWLVCMAVYMASGATSLASKMTAIFFPISAFIALGLEHSVANMFMIPLGMLRGADVSTSAFLMKNLLPVTLGNIVGGSVCVAMAYAAAYSQTLAGKTEANAPLPAGVALRGGATPGTKVTGSSFLPPATLERAAVGNMFEKVKLKKDPTEMWTDVHEYAAAIREGKTNWEDIASDDLDIRAKWAGMFHRRKATPGKFMMRLRIPNGILNSSHMRYYAECVRPYGEIGVVDITTRMNIQLRGMPFEDAADILKGLQARGQTSIMSGMDNLRNMVGSPIAGIDPHELIDTRELTKHIDSTYTNNGLGNPEWANMPRKFNIAISGSRDDFSHTHINDIGFVPVKHEVTGEVGFNIVLGGYFSIKRVAGAIPMNVWIKPSDAANFSFSVLRLFRDEGARLDRQKSRLMWLIEELGLPTFTERVLAEMRKSNPSFSFEAAQNHKEEWTLGHRELLGPNPQKQEGLTFIGVHVPVGRLYPDECEEIAALADKYSNGEIRLTVDQNVIFPNVDNAKVADFLAEPALGPGKRLSANPGHIVGHVISCTGSQFCPLAMVETKKSIDNITRKLQDIVDVPHPVRIHMTGCPNSCGQVQVADIGLMGAPAKKADATGTMKAVPGCNIFVGGKIGADSSLVTEPIMKGIPMAEDDLVPVLAKLLVERHGGVMKV